MADLAALTLACVLLMATLWMLVGCVPTDHVRDLGGYDVLLGDYSPGRYAWATEDPRRLDTPIPWRGRQGLWTLPDDVLAGSALAAAGGGR